jgi:hypothetical protein
MFRFEQGAADEDEKETGVKTVKLKASMSAFSRLRNRYFELIVRYVFDG